MTTASGFGRSRSGRQTGQYHRLPAASLSSSLLGVRQGRDLGEKIIAVADDGLVEQFGSGPVPKAFTEFDPQTLRDLVNLPLRLLPDGNSQERIVRVDQRAQAIRCKVLQFGTLRLQDKRQ